MIKVLQLSIGLFFLSGLAHSQCFTCDNPPAGVIFCDDFESQGLDTRYFDVSKVSIDNVGADNSKGLKVVFEDGVPDAGYLKKTFGKTPSNFIGDPPLNPTVDYKEIYWRFDMRTQDGWSGGGGGFVSRIMTFATSTQAQGMIGSIRTFPGDDMLSLEARTGIDENGVLVSTGQNDWGNLRYVADTIPATTEVFATANSNTWYCIEARVKLNTPGSSDGVFELWIDGVLEASLDTVDWHNTWEEYGINSIEMGNYWYSPGSPPIDQERYYDNLIISTQPIGCACVEVPVNVAPVGVDDDAKAYKNLPGTIDVLGNDTDANDDALSISAVTQGTNGTVVNNTSYVTYTPNVDYLGSDTFTYTVSDGLGGTAIATVTVIVEEPTSLTCFTCADAPAGTIFCDDFEDGTLSGKYFEVSNKLKMAEVGKAGSKGLRATFQPGTSSEAGSLKKSFGKTPDLYIGNPPLNQNTDYDEIYWRIDVRMQPGWYGGGAAKLSRVTTMATENWSQGMIGHIWSGGGSPDNYLIMDPASGIDLNGNLVTTKYNDFANLRWLGSKAGNIDLFSPENAGKWFCIETHVKLNTPGSSDGIMEFWINGIKQAGTYDMNWHADWNSDPNNYKLNTILIENYWNAGPPEVLERYFDNFVISTERIGCDACITNGGVDYIPDTPENLDTTAVTESKIDLAWTDISTNEKGFTIERSEDGGSTFTEIATLAANTSSYSDAAITVGESYHYRILAYNIEGGSSAYSNTLSVLFKKKNQAISITPIEDKLVNSDPFDVDASVDSGLELTYAVSGPASISGNTITLDGTAGTVTVTVSQVGDGSYNPAEANSSFMVSIITGLSDPEAGLEKKLSNFDVYPNPASTWLRIKGTYSDTATMRIFNILGEQALSLRLQENKKISVKSLKDGIYILILSDKGNIHTSKIMIQRE